MGPTGQKLFGSTALPTNICNECGGSGQEEYDIFLRQSPNRDVGEIKEGWRDCEWCDGSGEQGDSDD